MNTPTRLAAALLLFCLPPWVAAEPVGRVIMTVGPVQAVDASERERAVSRHDPVYAGERLRTGTPRGRAQVRFVDDGLIKLSPGTEFAIDEYREPETDDDSGRAVMSLVEGALRKISGRIGSRDEDEYEMNTPTATVGIRGTDYSLEYCDEDCVGDNRQLGLYGRVDDGSVVVENEFGTSEFGPGDHFFVPIDGTPGLLLTPPAGILDDIGETESDNGEAAEEVEVAVTPTVNGEPLDSDSEDTPVFESGDAVVEDLLTDAAPDSAVAFSRIDFGATDVLDGGLSTSVGLGLDRDAGMIVAVDSDGKAIDVMEAIPSTLGGSGETLGIEWGYWESGETGQFTVDGQPFNDGLIVFAAADGNLTTPDQLAGIGGTLQFGLGPDGPLVAFGENASYDIEQFDITLDIGALSGTLDTFRLASFDTDVEFFDEPLALDEDGGFVGTGLEGTYADPEDGGLAFADIDGVLVGENAEGGLVAFEVELDGSDQITGISILDADAYGEVQPGGATVPGPEPM